MPILGVFRAIVTVAIVAAVFFVILRLSGNSVSGFFSRGGRFGGYGRSRSKVKGQQRTGYTRPSASADNDDASYESPSEIVEVPIIEVTDVDEQD